MPFTSSDGERRYAALVHAAAHSAIGLDFDGTLSPIVDDPTRAHIHPDAADVIVALAEQVRAVAVVTGRPAAQVLALGELEALGDRIGAFGKEFYVFGQYGNERWSSSRRRIVGPPPPEGLGAFARELPRALRRAHAVDAYVEDKGLAVAVHTRRLDDADAAFERVLPELRDLAARHALVVEPGKSVIEVRSPGMHKGLVVEQLAAEVAAGGFCFAGDDLGDIEAFDAVEALADRGVPTLLVASESTEETALSARADVVVPGPEGVLAFLDQFTRDVVAAGG